MKLKQMIFAAAFALASSAAMAFHCPADMKKIDDALAKNPKLTSAGSSLCARLHFPDLLQQPSAFGVLGLLDQQKRASTESPAWRNGSKPPAVLRSEVGRLRERPSAVVARPSPPSGVGSS